MTFFLLVIFGKLYSFKKCGMICGKYLVYSLKWDKCLRTDVICLGVRDALSGVVEPLAASVFVDEAGHKNCYWRCDENVYNISIILTVC